MKPIPYELHSLKKQDAKVCTVILSYNGLNTLPQTLEAVQIQTRVPDTVLVVDNHSTDGTDKFLSSLQSQIASLVIIRTEENLGSAGGFSTGMTWAFENGYDYLWLLDDDSVPETDCLDYLLKALGTAPHTIAWPLNIDEKGYASYRPSWKGELMPRQVIERGGVPNKALFWGVEDTEYFSGRLRQQHNIKSIYIEDARVHFTHTNPRKSSVWHYYYRPRNMVYYRLWVQRPRRYHKLVLNLTKLWLKAALKDDYKIKKMRFMMLGIWHGLHSRLGKTIDPADFS